MTVKRAYLYKDLVVIPATVRTKEGLFVDANPVRAFNIDDQEGCLKYLGRLLSQEPALIDSEKREAPNTEEGTVILNALGLSKWRDFEKNSLMYMIHGKADGLTIYVTGEDDKGSWREDKSRTFEILDDKSTSEQALFIWTDMKRRFDHKAQDKKEEVVEETRPLKLLAPPQDN